jgi:hypothetical protein
MRPCPGARCLLELGMVEEARYFLEEKVAADAVLEGEVGSRSLWRRPRCLTPLRARAAILRGAAVLGRAAAAGRDGSAAEQS